MSTISDSHVGFDKPANPIGEVRALPAEPPLGMRYAPGERALDDEL